jgi:membrane protease YdiL (CAAX protease family)
VTEATTSQEHTFSFDLPDRRHIGGWLILIAIFSLMIGMQLAQYFKRGASDPESKYVAHARQLKMAVEMRQTMVVFGSKDHTSMMALYENLEGELAKDARVNAIAARLYAAARSERGVEIPKQVLDLLARSREPRDKFFAEVFAAKKIDPRRAKDLEVRLSGGGFVSKLARIQIAEKSGGTSRRSELISKGRAVFRLSVLSLAGISVIAGLLLWIVYFTFKSQGKLPRVGLPLERITLPDADRLALRCAQLFVMFLVAPFVVGQLADLGLDKHTANLILYSLLIIVTVWLFKFPIGGKVFSLASLGITRENLGKNLAWGFATAVANLPLVIGTALVGQWIFAGLPPPEHPTTVEVETGVGIYGTLVIMFAASVGAPILEEIMFRGTLLPALARVLGRPVGAIFLQGLIFAAIHPTGIPAWLPLASIGAMSGFVSRQTGSLVPSITMHAVHNFGTLLFAHAVLGNSG